MRIVVIGREGQVAQALRERAAEQGVDLAALGRPGIDLAEPAALADRLCAAIVSEGADLVVNAAAYTAVDRAEEERDAAFAVNASGAEAIAKAAALARLPVVHLSTDYVFDGTKPLPYVETDPTAPLGVYGLSKREGEERVAAANPDHAILRTSWVYSPYGTNFMRTMLRLTETRDHVRVVADQHGAPTSALDIADAILVIARNIMTERENGALRGTFHMTGTGATTWAGFAKAIFAERHRLGGGRVRVEPIATQDYPTPARRPANSRLDCAKLAAAHGVRLPAWQDSVQDVMMRLSKI